MFYRQTLRSPSVYPGNLRRMADESHEERIDRELIELLNELRVALPGAQVLFAFLLTVPFSNRFAQVTETQKYAYMVTLICTAVGSLLLIAPSSYHRLRFRQRDKDAILRTSNTLAIGGMAFLAVAIVAAVFLVADFLFHPALTIVLTGAVAVCCLVTWYAIPLRRRATEG
jgi:hypothetical protein